MSDTWLTHEELVREHRKLKAEYERTRHLVDVLIEKFASHTHYAENEIVPEGKFGCLRKVTSAPRSIQPPTPSRPSLETQAPAAPAEEAR
jgi:hypothetical protein